MATDIFIDPITRDFVDDGQGGWVETDDSSTAVLCQLESREAKWWGDARAGSQNAEILEGEVPMLDDLVDSTKRAMRVLGSAGLVDSITVSKLNEDSARGYGEIYLTWRDRASNKPADLAYAPLGGKP